MKTSTTPLYDLLIVGSGLYGSVIAYRARQKGLRCLVLEKRNHVGGNVYQEEKEGILIHRYGPHIFHTKHAEVWNFVNHFVRFNHFRYTPLARYKGQLYNLPFNMHTFYQIFGVHSPEEMKHCIEEEVNKEIIIEPKNLEEKAISLVGRTIYEYLIKGYTEKQWGRTAKELPAFIIERLPVRYMFDNNYFNDPYQGIPIGGYNKLIQGLLESIEVRLNTDFLFYRDEYEKIAHQIVYTSSIDAFYDYRYGHLEYRSLRFEDTLYSYENHQGCAAINETDIAVPYTRTIEHKHFEFGTQPVTIVTREYPVEWHEGVEPFYPISDERNITLFNHYRELADQETNVMFGGRMGDYRYYDMDTVIRKALEVDFYKLFLKSH